MMLATCLATVAGLMTSSPAMALLLRPCAISAAISRSRRVSELGGVVALALGATSGALPGDWRAREIAPSADRARPRDHSRSTTWFPRRRAGARYRSARAP